MIVPIGAWVLEEAVGRCSSGKHAATAARCFCVNVLAGISEPLIWCSLAADGFSPRPVFNRPS